MPKVWEATMRFHRLFPAFVLILFAGVAPLAAQQQRPANAPAAKPMVMSISAFADGTDIPPKYTQAGDQTSPPISWINTPAGTVSFVLHVHDLEGARNKTTE